ncbi:NAD-glutamate dehydrogenase domain-containing protein [Mycobacterium sp. 236(2023)]|uniref:NAD-glutamate dehydrogenase domain-containing protein n=1 Tax=Mycobacterium sp. 236(2023) TaxID=3038163 RepID=UPI002414EEF3|nr:NAD-glutamate dehydrogenase domain-containing protein [Mycobacterium sp. 236(2023)]MDG4669344.1 NAD-glutamate dehydrogenase [Mycobacterium sp. 236(2023)]
MTQHLNTPAPDAAEHLVSVIVTLPRADYTVDTREALELALGETTAAIEELHHTRHDPGPDAAVTGWDDAAAALSAAAALPRAAATSYLAALPAGYKAQTTPERAVDDIAHLLALAPGVIDTSLRRDTGTGLRCALYTRDQQIELSALIPVLQSLGMTVIDEYPYLVQPPAAPPGRIYVLNVQLPRDVNVDAEALHRMQDAFAAIWRGDADTDGFNELVSRAGLHWRQAALLRAYTAYLRQLGFTSSAHYLQRVLLAHPVLVCDIIELFCARFDPVRDSDTRTARADAARDRIHAGLETVSSLDADRILRALLGAVQATVRTNYFRRDSAGRVRPYLSLKLRPRDITGFTVPAPHPLFEIFVHSPDVEGVHLRFGPVSRGGLRWSDRLEDYRTEILGLVKAQTVKNAVIVPVGAKGGFVVRRPAPATGGRAHQWAKGQDCYRAFIGGLLDVTDNIDSATGAAMTPAQVVRYDEPDPYLVVAADKGTATFSDIANAVAADHNFWLQDAFASGGSIGYDHKALGITAKGAWESVKRHFRELGRDIQRADFTVAGVGDMSGDVFGNAMLLSPHIRLIAAFDHRHIFLDPTPDAASSYVERTRVFSLERSTWLDYNTAAISPGGGVFARTAKAIPLNDDIRGALDIDSAVSTCTPAELIRAILTAPVDLLFNGGIGTYVKANHESHLDVGDKTNDDLRVDADQLRARVIGEGGNLGLTQQARIQFAHHGGRINTDAFDNSAGVNCSDHEVNIKIVLQTLARDSQLGEDERRQLLSEMAGEVSALVLKDNINHNEVLGISRVDPAGILAVHARLIDHLEHKYGLDRTLETLPDRDEILQREKAGLGLASPELATLLAHVKLALKTDMLNSTLPDADLFAAELPKYFPAQLAQRYPDAIATHALRREIVTTMVVNDIVETGGISYAFRLQEETGVAATDAIRAHAAVSRIYGLVSLRRKIFDLEPHVDVEVTDTLSLAIRRLLDRTSRWMLLYRPQPLATGAEVTRFRDPVRTLIPDIATWLQGQEGRDFASAVDDLVTRGVAPEAAHWFISHLHGPGLLDVADIADLTEQQPRRVAALYYALSDELGIGRLAETIAAMATHDKWDHLARLTLHDEALAVLRTVTTDILLTAETGEPVEAMIDEWRTTNRARIDRAAILLAEVGVLEQPGLAALSVAVGHVRAMVQRTHRHPGPR